MKSGFVSVIGRPNTGKSTLINTVVGEKITITSNKPQTTRNIIQGVYNDNDSQIVFVDTPGIHKPLHKLGFLLNEKAYYTFDDVDIILFMVNADEKIGPIDLYISEKLKTIKKPIFLVINKIDKISNDDILLKINEYKDICDFAEVIPISALKNDNVDRLINVLKEYLPDQVKYFNETDKTSATKEFRICEIVREKILSNTSQEVPYSVACILSSIKEESKIITIFVDVIVDKDSIKKIILGKNGNKIKQIGMEARVDIETLLGKQVYLELYVKTLKKWRDNKKHLKTLGFINKHE